MPYLTGATSVRRIPFESVAKEQIEESVTCGTTELISLSRDFHPVTIDVL
jgi:hypothetical protein